MDKSLYKVVLKEKIFGEGLTKEDTIELFSLLDGAEACPLELVAMEHECSAMGFIAVDEAESIDYGYTESGLGNYVASILDDMNNESPNCEYTFRGISIWLSR